MIEYVVVVMVLLEEVEVVMEEEAHLSVEPGPGVYRGFFSTDSRWLVARSTASQAGSYLSTTSSSAATSSPTSSTCKGRREEGREKGPGGARRRSRRKEDG